MESLSWDSWVQKFSPLSMKRVEKSNTGDKNPTKTNLREVHAPGTVTAEEKKKAQF